MNGTVGVKLRSDGTGCQTASELLVLVSSSFVLCVCSQPEAREMHFLANLR